MIAVLEWLVHHWYWWFWLWVLGFFDGVRDFFAGIGRSVAGIGHSRHKRRMKELRLELAIEAARRDGTPLPAARPGRCVHRNVAPVIPATEEAPVGWLCKSCDARLPADWAVREEDL